MSIDMGGETVEGSGASATRTEAATDIRRVGLSVPGTLTITVGEARPLEIEGDDNIVDQLIIERDGDELEIRAPRGVNFYTDVPLIFRLGVERLEALSLAGSGRIETGNVDADDFAVSVAGSGEVVVEELYADRLNVSIAGSGDVVLSGAAESADVDIAGSGNVHAAALDVQRADVNVAGSGDTELRVRDHLDVNIMGSGGVRYHGDPEVDRSVMGSGDIVRAGD